MQKLIGELYRNRFNRMPDPWIILQSQAAACLITVAFTVVAGRIGSGRYLEPVVAAGWAIGILLAFWSGLYLLDLPVHWPPAQDRDRVFWLILPAAAFVECIGTAARLGQAWRWILRGAVAFSLVRILLHGSIYLEDLAGNESRFWSMSQTVAVSVAVGIVVLATSAVAVWSAGRGSFGNVTWVLATVLGSSGMAVMLSGYATGGQPVFPVAAAIIGCWIGWRLLPGSKRDQCKAACGAPVFVAVVFLANLLVSGRCFAELTTTHAVALGCAPLALVATVFWHPARSRWLPGVLTWVVVLAICGLVVFQAQQRFVERSTPVGDDPSDEIPAPSIDDYFDFGQ